MFETPPDPRDPVLNPAAKRQPTPLPPAPCTCFHFERYQELYTERLELSRLERLGTLSVPEPDEHGFYPRDTYRLYLFYEAQRLCWHRDPEWQKLRGWDRRAPWCWNLRMWLDREPCKHWTWKPGPRSQEVGMPRLGPPRLRDMKVSVQKKAACKGCGEEEMETVVTYSFFGPGDSSQEGPLVWFPGAAQLVEGPPTCLMAREETK